MIFKGDDTGAFGVEWLTINLAEADKLTITKAEFRCGEVVKTFEEPEFPIKVNLTSEETAKLKAENTCYLAIYDEDGLKKTCQGAFTFDATNRRV